MATKPATLPRPWATLANYDTGPFIGQPMKVDPGVGIAASGHRPGAASPTPAEYENYQQNLVTASWIPWVNAGSFAGAADAHIVESDSVGRSALVGLDLDDAVDETVLNVIGVNTLAPAVLVDASAGGTAYQATIAPGGTGFTTTVASGPGGQGFSVDMVGAIVGVAGMRISMDAATTGEGIEITSANGKCLDINSSGSFDAVVITATGIARALDVNGSSSSSSACTMSGGTGQTLSVVPGISGANGIAVSSGPGAGDVALLATNLNNTGFVVRATPPNTGTSASRGFYCSTGTGAGIAAEFVSSGTGASGNYAISLSGDTTSPTKGIVFMQPQNADPSGGGESGGLAFSTAKGLTGGNFADGTWRSYWNSVNGYACAFVNNSGYGALGLTLPNSIFSIVGTITTANTGDEIKVANATILVRLSFSMKSNSTTDTVLSIRVRDVTDGNTIVWERIGTGSSDNAGYFIPGNDAATNRYWVPGPAVEIELTPSAVGTRQYTVSMCAPTNVALRIRDLTAAFVGTVA